MTSNNPTVSSANEKKKKKDHYDDVVDSSSCATPTPTPEKRGDKKDDNINDGCSDHQPLGSNNAATAIITPRNSNSDNATATATTTTPTTTTPTPPLLVTLATVAAATAAANQNDENYNEKVDETIKEGDEEAYDERQRLPYKTDDDWNEKFHCFMACQVLKEDGIISEEDVNNNNDDFDDDDPLMELEMKAWINQQENAKKEGKLSEEQVEKLNTLLEWHPPTISSSVAAATQTTTTSTCRTRSSTGRKRKSRSLNETSAAAAAAAKTTRNDKKQRSSEEANWNKMYLKLVEYHKRFGHLWIRGAAADAMTTTAKKYGGLLEWIEIQRRNQHNNKLSKEQYKKLKDVGFDFSKKTTTPEQEAQLYFNHMCEKLVEYKDKNNGTFSGVTQESSFRLGAWAMAIRKAYRNNVLTQRQIQKLESIGFSLEARRRKQPTINDKGKPDVVHNNWTPTTLVRPTWEQMYQRLVEYKKLFGHTHVPRLDGTDPKLNRWVRSQREQRANGNNPHMTEERIQRLEELGFEWSKSIPKNPVVGTFDIAWKERFEQLKRYKEVRGETRVLRGELYSFKLNDWVNKQKLLYSRGQMRQDRIDMLNSIEFDWTRYPKQRRPQQQQSLQLPARPLSFRIARQRLQMGSIQEHLHIKNSNTTTSPERRFELTYDDGKVEWLTLEEAEEGRQLLESTMSTAPTTTLPLNTPPTNNNNTGLAERPMIQGEEENPNPASAAQI